MRALLGSVGLVTSLAGLCGCEFRPAGGPGDDLPLDAVADDAPAGDSPSPIDARLIDGAAIDAPPPFNEGSCPSGYIDMGDTPSRYRVIGSDDWLDAQATCRGHSAGLTHLAVFSGTGERDAVGAYLFFIAADGRRLWLGTWHDGTMARTVTGEPLYPNVNLQNNQAVSWERSLVTPFFVEALNTRNAALCECDGRASSPP